MNRLAIRILVASLVAVLVAPAAALAAPDITPPVGTVSIEGGADLTTSLSVTVATPATDDATGVTEIQLSNDGLAWTLRPYADTQAWTLLPGSGGKFVWVKWKDGAGNWSEPVTDDITFDNVAPTASLDDWYIQTGFSLATQLPKLSLRVSGTDDATGIKQLEIAQSTDGGPFVTFATQTAQLLDRPVALGHLYQFAVRATDNAGNVGEWAYGPVSRVRAISQSIPAVHYTGPWSNVTSSSIWWGGTARSSSTTGSTVSYTFTGRAIAWVSVSAKTRGNARIYVDGKLSTTLNLWLPTVHKKYLVWQKSWPTSSTHTIKIVVLGTAGRPRIDIDGFITAS